jgi:transcriptional regulator with AAA-type ATPase domain
VWRPMTGPMSRTLLACYAASALGAMASVATSPLAGGVAAVCFGIAASACLTLLAPRKSAVLQQGLLSGILPPPPRGFEMTASILWAGLASWLLFADGNADLAFPIVCWVTFALLVGKATVLARRYSFAEDPASYKASAGIVLLAGSASVLIGLLDAVRMVAAAGVGVAVAMVATSVLAASRSLGRRGPIAGATYELLISSAVVVGATGIGFALNQDPSPVVLSAGVGALVLVGGGIAAAVSTLVLRAFARPSVCVETLWEAAQIAERKGGRDDETLEDTLAHLGHLSLREQARPEVWLLDDAQALRSDLAGRAQRSAGDVRVTSRVLRLASAEPLGVLRREIAERYSHSVDVKMASEWLKDRGAACAAQLGTPDDPLGLLLLPVGNSTVSLGVGELEALRELCDRLAAPLRARAILKRSLAREQQVQAELDRALENIDHLKQQIHANADQHRRFADLLAKPLDSATYSPHFRLAREKLDRFANSMPAVAMVVPPGVDPKPWAARFHTRSARAEQALICVDAATLAVELADGATRLPSAGTLAVFDVTALTLPLQQHLADWLAERRLGSGLPDGVGPGLVVSSFAPPAELQRRGLLGAGLSAWLTESCVVAPRLSERPEDLRALILDVLCRVGLRTRGEPLGLAAEGQSELLEQLFGEAFTANDTELDALIYRAAARAQDQRPGHCDVLQLDDLRAAGMRVDSAEGTADGGAVSAPARDKLAPC